jgi:serine/threonine protein kinase
MALASAIELPARYRVVRHIASGGMASVWEAEDLLLGRVVAVKLLAARYAADPGARERFQREARTAAQVSGATNVVTIYDIGEHGDDAFIVMEHFAGGTVADGLRAARDAGRRVARETALRWLREAAAGLDVAHAAGIVHRDVKPANLLLDARGRLAVGDFGIARLADDTQMTKTGQVLGTAAYISPEQARGHAATPASDRYALAIVAYELLTGVRPFGDGPATVQALAHAESAPPLASEVAPDLPPALDAAFARGLAKDPAARPRSAGQLVATIARALGEDGSLGAPGTADPTLQRPIAGPAVSPSHSQIPATPGAPDVPAPPQSPGGAAASRPRDPTRGRPGGVPHVEALAPRRTTRLRARPAPPSSSPPASRGRRRPIGALVAGVAVIAAVAAAFVLASGGDPRKSAPEGRQASHGSDAARATAGKSAKAASQPAAPALPPATAPAKTTPQAPSPADLNDRGFALEQQGRYAEAVAPLEAAVAAYKSSGEAGLPYAYALFNLAVALNRSGNPAAAIPMLRERLTFDNQRSTVQAELDSALAKVNGPAAAPGPGPAAAAPAGPGAVKHAGKQHNGRGRKRDHG